MLGRTSNCPDSNGTGVYPFGASDGGVAKEKKTTTAAGRKRTKPAGGGGGRSGLGDCRG